MDKFDLGEKRTVTRDWLDYFPAMVSYKPMWLLKRNGPLLLGICLDGNRDNTSYRVIPHVHNLSRESNFISLTLWNPLPDERNYYHQSITVKSHKRVFVDACLRLQKLSLFPLTNDLSLSRILLAYETYLGLDMPTTKYPILLYDDIIRLLVYCDRIAEAKTRLASYLRIMSRWPDTAFKNPQELTQFSDGMKEIIEAPSRLESICEAAIIQLKVERIPDYGLVCEK